MPEFIAKQLESHLTEADAIGQAKDGEAAAFEDLYKAHNRRVCSVCLRMTRNPGRSRIFNTADILAGVSKDRDVPRRVRFFNLAASSDCKRCLDASSPQETG